MSPSSPTGQFTFNSILTDSTGARGASLTGNVFASYLFGQVQNFSIDLQPNVLRPRAKIAEFFAQDDWKATKRSTLNLGLRCTLNFPSTEKDNQATVFNLKTGRLDYLAPD